MLKLKITNEDKTTKIIELDEKFRDKLEGNFESFKNNFHHCVLPEITSCSDCPLNHCKNMISLEILEENEKVSLREMKNDVKYSFKTNPNKFRWHNDTLQIRVFSGWTQCKFTIDNFKGKCFTEYKEPKTTKVYLHVFKNGKSIHHLSSFSEKAEMNNCELIETFEHTVKL